MYIYENEDTKRDENKLILYIYARIFWPIYLKIRESNNKEKKEEHIDIFIAKYRKLVGSFVVINQKN